MQKSVKDELDAVAADMLRHHEQRTVRLAPDVMLVDSNIYTDPVQFELERDRIFHKTPIMLAMTCELKSPGDYKTMEVAGTPVLLVRGKDGEARVFLNSCTHRGAVLAQGCGRAARFTCPYHGWTFSQQGDLVGIARANIFGAVEKQDFALKAFPSLEKAGMIWAVLDTSATLDIGGFLAGYEQFLEAFGFESWTLLDSRPLTGPNWKLCFDAHLEFYHLPVLHKNTFGPQISPETLYYAYGPHQRLARPSPTRAMPQGLDIFELSDKSPDEWPVESLLFGEWILFPNVSINSFYSGGRGAIVSQVIPGESVGESITVQMYLMAEEPNAEDREIARQQAAFLAQVVGDEDLPTSAGQQRVLKSGALDRVCFGRNEGGLQHFHNWIDKIVQAPTSELGELFSRTGSATWHEPAI